jgi:hypothetical protein
MRVPDSACEIANFGGIIFPAVNSRQGVPDNKFFCATWRLKACPVHPPRVDQRELAD